MAKDNERPIIIVRRTRKEAPAHHGGAWKVAYADFVTAMMAFFLVMWLITSVSKDQRAAIFDYFKNPSMQPGKSAKPAPGQVGPGGASTSPINLHGGLDAPKSYQPRPGRPAFIELARDVGAGAARDPKEAAPATVPVAAAEQKDTPPDPKVAAAIAEATERKKLESLLEDLRKAIDQSQALKPFKDQLLLDITSEGLRMQIVDAQNRPMFDLGSSKLKNYTTEILHEVAKYLDTVPNRISLSGHTDVKPYLGIKGYSNWELSADRANAARRALEDGGLTDEKIARVVGLSSSVLFDKEHPESPINRRISIVVLSKKFDTAIAGSDAKEPAPADPAAPQPSADPALAAPGAGTVGLSAPRLSPAETTPR